MTENSNDNENSFDNLWEDFYGTHIANGPEVDDSYFAAYLMIPEDVDADPTELFEKWWGWHYRSEAKSRVIPVYLFGCNFGKNLGKTDAIREAGKVKEFLEYLGLRNVFLKGMMRFPDINEVVHVHSGFFLGANSPLQPVFDSPVKTSSKILEKVIEMAERNELDDKDRVILDNLKSILGNKGSGDVYRSLAEVF